METYLRPYVQTYRFDGSEISSTTVHAISLEDTREVLRMIPDAAYAVLRDERGHYCLRARASEAY